MTRIPLISTLLLGAVVASAQSDPTIEKARGAVESFAQELPNYLCQQVTTRYVSPTRAMNWRRHDEFSAEVIYENGKESYRNVTLGGKAVNLQQLPGAWSTGEFGSQLWDLFMTSTATEFHFRRDESSHGRPVAIYDYVVTQENSHWGLMVAPRLLYAAHKGSLWIDKETGRVLRLERRAYDLPRDFGLIRVDATISYEYVRIGGAREFLLPAHSELVMCQRGASSCNKNEIDFRNYRKYTGEASIKFDE